MASDFRNLIVSAFARRTQALSRVRAGEQSRKAGRRKFRSKFSARETTVRGVYVIPEEGTNDDAADVASVVHVRRLGRLSRKNSRFAARRALTTPCSKPAVGARGCYWPTSFFQ